MGLNSLRGGVVDKPNLKYSIHILNSIKNYVMWEVHIGSYCFELLQHFQYGLKQVQTTNNHLGISDERITQLHVSCNVNDW